MIMFITFLDVFDRAFDDMVENFDTLAKSLELYQGLILHSSDIVSVNESNRRSSIGIRSFQGNVFESYIPTWCSKRAIEVDANRRTDRPRDIFKRQILEFEGGGVAEGRLTRDFVVALVDVDGLCGILHNEVAESHVGDATSAAAATLWRSAHLNANPGLEVCASAHIGASVDGIDQLADVDIADADVGDVVRVTWILANAAKRDATSDTRHVAQDDIGGIAFGSEAVVSTSENPVLQFESVHTHGIDAINIGCVVGAIASGIGVGAVDVYVGEGNILRVLSPD